MLALDGQVYCPPVIRVMRNHVDEKTGRVTEDLFVEEKLAAGTRFASEIIFPHAGHYGDFRSAFNEVLSGPVGLGRGRKKAHIIKAVAEPIQTQELDGPPPDRLVVHLTSDAISRDDSLRYRADLSRVIENIAVGYEVERGFCRTHQVSAFSPFGGLPDFGSVAVEAGSSYLLHKTGTEDEARKGVNNLRKLSSTSGLGENLLAGYGRFLVEETEPQWKAGTQTPAFEPTGLPRREQTIREAKTFVKEHRGALRKLSATQLYRLLYLLRQPGVDKGAAFKALTDRSTRGGQKWKEHPETTRALMSRINDKKDILFLEFVIRWFEVDEKGGGTGRQHERN